MYRIMTCLGIAIVTVIAATSQAQSPPAYAHFPDAFSPDLPYDVDGDAFSKLDLKTQVPEAQRLFDIFAWQTFLGVNWPAKPDGSADPAKTLADSTSPRVWMGWTPNENIFRPNGEKPVAWNAAAALKEPSHYLWRMSKMLGETSSPVNQLHESNQAFTGPLVDQNGNFVRYESYMNKEEYDYIVTNTLYNQEGQAEFISGKGQIIDFPVGEAQPTKKRGSMGIKLAWKELGAGDIPERFLTRKVTIVKTSYDKDNKPIKKEVPSTVGLVGMHVTALTKSSPNWIWSTFEHVDNVVSNDLEWVHSKDGVKRVLPNFNNPAAPLKLVNVLPPMNAVPDSTGKFTTWDESKTKDPVQLTRVVPIPPALQELNREVQEKLRKLGSVFQYYELIGAQWPVQPGFPAFPGGDKSAPESIVFKAPGRPVPVFVINTTMESYFQTGVQDAGPSEEDDRLPFGFWADQPTERVSPDRTKVFATESCVGCHFSAGAVIAFRKDEKGNVLRDVTGLKIPIYGKNGSFGRTGNAAYLWQFQLKSRQAEPPVPPGGETAPPSKPGSRPNELNPVR